MDTSTIGKAGVQRNKNVGPNPKHTSFDNFEDSNFGMSTAKAKAMRGHKAINPTNVRGKQS